MSRGFQVRPVTWGQVEAVRRQGNIPAQTASVVARMDNLEEAIHGARDIEDVKVCLLAILNTVRPRL